MTDVRIPASPTAASRHEQLFPKLTPRQLARFSAQGRTRQTTEREARDLRGCRRPVFPAVFAAGDVRSGSIKRVASAVGEGAIAVSFAHLALSE